MLSSQIENISAISQPRQGETALENFVQSVAHELREPLRTITMFSELLVREVNPDDKSRYAHLIVDSVGRMSSMLEGLYELALSGTEEPETALDLAQLVSEAMLNLEHAMGIPDAVVNTGVLPLVKGNRKQLLRVLQNLLANAIKYRGKAPLEIQIAAEQRGARWVISVRDNGIGIAPQYQEQIFHRFARLHGPGVSGAGLGLAVCRKLIEGMGGIIWVESKLGVGSTFRFTVEAARPAAQALELAAAVGLQSMAS